MRLFRRSLLISAGLLALPLPVLAAPPVRIVAAENMYGDIAAQIAGPRAGVVSILQNPNQDPHLFTASPLVARDLAAADIVIVNGADYDPWMDNLLGAGAAPGRIVITVARLIGRQPGDNPHLWYDPAAIPALTIALTAALTRLDPAHGTVYAANAAALTTSLTPIHEKTAALRARYAGTPVTATEPVFGLMAAALGLNMKNQRFQIAVMNGTEPAPADVAAIERDLRAKTVKILFYNAQVTDDLTATLRGIAAAAGISVIGVTETEPPGVSYQNWMLNGLNAVDAALSR